MISKINFKEASGVNTTPIRPNNVNKNNSIQIQATQNSDMLPAFLDALKSYNMNNVNQITFGNSMGVHKKTTQRLKNEINKRVTGHDVITNTEVKWPINKNAKINAWMVTAETDTFMKTGGLAEVAVQLPDAFNLRLKDKGNNMTIVTPLYLGEGTEKRNLSITPVPDQPNKYIYSGQNCKDMEIEKTGSFKIKVYKSPTEYENQKIEIFTGLHANNTRYIFLRNDNFFSVKPAASNPDFLKGPYVNNEHGVDEATRMLVMSKASVELMKQLHEGKMINDDVQAPNVIIANDWHASPMSGFMRIAAPIEVDQKKLEQSTLAYFDRTPIVHITHNAQYQGIKEGKDESETLFKTVFGENLNIVKDNLNGVKGDKNPLKIGKQTDINPTTGKKTHSYAFNSALFNLNLADRCSAVSNNYAHELCKAPDLGCGMQVVNNERKDANPQRTMLGIVNGYTKSKAEASEAFIEKINRVLTLPENPLKPYAGLYNSTGYAIKMENKNAMMQFLKEVSSGKRDNNLVKLYDPANCDISNIKDISKVPVVCSVGRFVDQKGFDYLAKTIELTMARPGFADEEAPMFIVMGSGDEATSKLFKDLKHDLITIGEKEIKRAQRDMENAKKELNVFSRYHHAGKKTEKAKNDLAEAETTMKMAKRKYDAGKRLCLVEGFNNELRDIFYCGSDFMAITSKFEPCGLIQMETMAKGTIPIATSTGGLKDTITDGENGFLTNRFFGFNSNSLIYDNGQPFNDMLVDNVSAIDEAMTRALRMYYKSPETIQEMSIAAMEKDFSWDVRGGALDQYWNLMKTGHKDLHAEI